MLRTGMIAAVLALAAAAGAAQAAEYTSIVQTIDVAKPIDVVMKKTAGYCDIAGWFKTTCVYTSGSGEVGTVRRIGDRIDEVLVAKTARSYTYAQPLAPNSYHGTVEYQPIDAGHTRIVYALFTDLAPLASAEAKAANRDGLAKRFKGVLDTMKAVAEAP